MSRDFPRDPVGTEKGDELVAAVASRSRMRAAEGRGPGEPGLPRWTSEFDDLGFKPEVRDEVMLDNAKKLVGHVQSTDATAATADEEPRRG